MVNPWHLLIVLLGGAIAFAASITYALVMDADGQNFSERKAVESATLPDRTNCDDIYGTAYRSGAERAWFSANCSSWAASVGYVPETNGGGPGAGAAASPQPAPTPRPVSPAPDGRDCNAIRGTPYRSSAERDWYLQNCQGNTAPGQAATPAAASTPPPAATPATTGTAQAQPTPAAGDRADCSQIRGTPYRSSTERAWYQANCLNQPPAQATPNSTPGAQPAAPATAPPDRTDCNQIRGTPYRSNAERAWYQANCLNQAPTPAPQPTLQATPPR